MNVTELKTWIKQYESLRLNPYLDITGHVTIGWGRNLDNGITVNEAELMFENDWIECIAELAAHNWYIQQPENIKNALINMNFTLGINKLLGFKKMIAALEKKDYTTAAAEALDSKWASQVGQRAKDIAVMIREG